MQETRPLLLDESALTGIEEIDRQHQHLLNLFNDANQALTLNVSPVHTGSVVRELLGYSIYHFNTEESLMREYAVTAEEKSEADEHIAQHRQFSQRIVSLQEKLLKRRYVDPDELLAFLTGWIDEHVMGTDKTLARLILNRRGQ